MEEASTVALPPPRVEALSLSLSLSGLSAAIPPEYVRPEEERTDLADAFDQARRESEAQDYDDTIPVVDITAFDDEDEDGGAHVVEAVREAAAEWGVMHLAGHGIPPEVLDAVRAAGTAFFALPVDAKEAYANDPAAGRMQGYGSRLATNASGHREWEDYLFHLLYPDRLADAAAWPAHPPDYAAVTRDFGRRVRLLASKLLAIMSLGLGLPRGTLEQQLQGAADDDELLLQLKINYYPRCPQPELAVGVEAHTDVSALTFILHNGVPGLQVHHGGRWVTARPSPEPDTLIVHVGDSLEILSNGRYRSVLHRGLVNRQAVRVSWVVFCEPPPDAVLLRPLPELVTEEEPARFAPRTFRQHKERKVFRKQQEEVKERSSSIAMT